MILGVSGKACSGKNAVTRLFESRGFESVDIDKLGHLVIEQNSQEIIAIFGDGIADGNNVIDRTRLGRIVFKDREKMKILENIIHPGAIRMVENIVEEFNGENLVLNSALLGIAGMDRLCDRVLWVETGLLRRVHWAITRDRKKLSHIFARIRSQANLTIQHFSPGVDIYMVRNNGNLADLEKQIVKFLEFSENCKRV